MSLNPENGKGDSNIKKDRSTAYRSTASNNFIISSVPNFSSDAGISISTIFNTYSKRDFSNSKMVGLFLILLL